MPTIRAFIFVYLYMKNGIIYCIKNLINNKCYIGQTICSLHKRKIEHLNCAKNKRPHFKGWKII